MFGLPLTNEPCVENRLEARGWYVALQIDPVLEFQAKVHSRILATMSASSAQFFCSFNIVHCVYIGVIRSYSE